MTRTDFSFIDAFDGATIRGTRWMPSAGTKLRGILQISHGMVEHSLRYERLAERLCASGFGVYAHDHRGHGRTAGGVDKVGYLADSKGFELLVNNVNQVTRMARNENRGLPVFLFGHSMGSFVAQSYIQRFSSDVDGCILSGTNGRQAFIHKMSRIAADAEARRIGRKTPSEKLTKLAFGKYNDDFMPARTAFEWLSRDSAEVDKYIADPYCGCVCTAGFYQDFTRGLIDIEKPANLKKIRKDLPVYIMSGDMDPVGLKGRGPSTLAETYHRLGLGSVDLRLYGGGRHEMLNEVNRDEVMADILAWLESKIVS